MLLLRNRNCKYLVYLFILVLGKYYECIMFLFIGFELLGLVMKFLF